MIIYKKKNIYIKKIKMIKIQLLFKMQIDKNTLRIKKIKNVKYKLIKW